MLCHISSSLFPVWATKRVSVKSDISFCFLSTEEMEDAMYRSEASSQSSMLCHLPSRECCELHLFIITDSRCRWLKAGALQEKKRKRRRQKKKKTSTWSFCFSSLWLLSLRLALLLQGSTASNRTYDFIRGGTQRPFLLLLSYT